MSEEANAAIIDNTNPTADFVELPLADVSERYIERLEIAEQTEIALLLSAMGIEKTDEKLVLTFSGVKERLEQRGIAAPFDLMAVPEAVVSPTKYLELMTQGFAPVGTESRDTMLHDSVFHGVGFVGLDTPLADLIKNASRHALSTGDARVISACVESIDGLTGAYFGSFVGPSEPTHDIAEHVSLLGGVLSTKLPGQSMGETSAQQKAGQLIAQSAESMAIAGVSHFNTLLTSLNQAQAA